MVASVDTSAVLKLYTDEVGSRWMVEEIRPGGIAISELTIAEVAVSLSRRTQDGTLPARDARRVWRTFRRDLRSFVVARLSQPSLIGAGLLAARSPVLLRTLDAIQLQGASEIAREARRLGQAEPLFISADIRLLEAAEALGFRTDNPLNHL